MSGNIAGEVETLNKKSNKDEGVTLLHNPAYREKYMERFYEAQKKVMDMVQLYDGTIILIESKIAMYYFSWHRKKREFERKKQQAMIKNDASA
ncbi:hypothetical protein [Wolbachia endosymbiont of Cantharis cryptica]|uniref:hypothetical protein n=1 Tax=Wolbachia endosymbiont of Cantharis cryptica TaxID=3066132 RepID=UPI00376EBF17